MNRKTIALVMILAVMAAMWASAEAVEVKVKAAATADAGAKKADRPGAWMGIRMGLVPEALAEHLRLGERGVIVRNVAAGSGADKALLGRYDVIVQLDGKDVRGMAELARDIGRRKPGDRVKLHVIQKGKRRSLTVTLAEPPPLGKVEMKYDEPVPIWEDHLNWKGGTLRKGPRGWTIRGRKVPEEVEKFLKDMPKSGAAQVQVRVHAGEGGRWQWKMKRTLDGKTVQIQQEEGGKIVVAKSRAEGGKAKSVTREYKDANDLRKHDPEAYEMYNGVKAPRIKVMPGIRIQPGKIGEHLRKFRLTAPKVIKGEAREIEERLRRQAREMRRQIQDAVAKARTRITVVPPMHLRGFAKGLFERGRPFGPAVADREFKVDENGRIEVRIRKGRDDLVLRFRSVKELKAKHPKLYEEYQKLLKSEE